MRSISVGTPATSASTADRYGAAWADTSALVSFIANLIRNASRLLVPPVIEPVALKAAKLREGSRERLALIHVACLPARSDRIATEERGIERHARLEREPLVGGPIQQWERGEVAHVVPEDLFRDAVPRNRDIRESISPVLQRG